MKQDYATISRTVADLRKLYPKYLETIKDSSCDKHGFGLNADSRFSIFKITVSLDTWTGYYGDSGCCPFGGVGDQELFKDYFIKWLSKQLPRMFTEIADAIEKDSTVAKNKRIAELKEELARLQS